MHASSVILHGLRNKFNGCGLGESISSGRCCPCGSMPLSSYAKSLTYDNGSISELDKNSAIGFQSEQGSAISSTSMLVCIHRHLIVWFILMVETQSG